MNFFESQDAAKRNTGRLILLFGLAVLSLIIVTNLLVMLVFGFASTEMTSMGAVEQPRFSWYTFFVVGAAVTGVVLIGSLYKIGSLSGGGARIAEMMNGRLLVAGSNDLREQRVLNVVEEMAIASGTPVPPVYLMEEEGINAFAAGYSPSDAVIGITRGAIEALSRDQLQGVIAHEFSHILHGDMRINIRLIGVLHGIMVLGIIGYHLMRGGSYSRRSKDSGGIVMLGLGLLVVGYVGTFFGKLIKAAVSRQREYLADASAVQFTRNPNGIAGALMQIAQHSNHSYLSNPSSTEISHALFEEGQISRLRWLYATHPPLEERIGAILPNWDGSYDLARKPVDQAQEAETKASDSERRDKFTAVLTGTTGVVLTDALLNQVGNPDSAHLQFADDLLKRIPPAILGAAREPSGARALVYLLVMSESEDEFQTQLDFMQGCADIGVFEELEKLVEYRDGIQPEHRLSLVDIAVSSLRQLSAKQFQLFKANFTKLISLDKKINLLEWSLQKIVFHHLDAVFEKGKAPKLGKKDLKRTQESCSVLLSMLVHSNSHKDLESEDVFSVGAEKLGLALTLKPAREISFDALNAALDELTALKPLQKPALLKASAACITADGEVAAIEAELLRAVAAIIDCPMPPLHT